jgi:hypothetical protein
MRSERVERQACCHGNKRSGKILYRKAQHHYRRRRSLQIADAMAEKEDFREFHRSGYSCPGFEQTDRSMSCLLQSVGRNGSPVRSDALAPLVKRDEASRQNPDDTNTDWSARSGAERIRYSAAWEPCFEAVALWLAARPVRYGLSVRLDELSVQLAVRFARAVEHRVNSQLQVNFAKR